MVGVGMHLKRDLKLALDRVAFVKAAGFEPDDWQAEVLRSSSRRKLLCCARQSGKSLTVGAVCLHTAMYVPRSLSLIFAPSQNQSVEFFRRVTDLAHGLGMDWLDPESLTQKGMELPNGSRIQARPGSERSARSRTANLLVIDEAARISDELYHSLRPMLATTGGPLCMLSTPAGKRGAFWEAWQYGEAWKRWLITADDLPDDRYKPDKESFLKEERAALPHKVYQQEYYCEFLEPDDAVFYEEDIVAATSSEVTPLFEKRSA